MRRPPCGRKHQEERPATTNEIIESVVTIVLVQDVQDPDHLFHVSGKSVLFSFLIFLCDHLCQCQFPRSILIFNGIAISKVQLLILNAWF